MRPETTLRQCHPFNRFAVTAVLLVEFIQFNALSFNPALGAWSDLRAVASQYYSFSFLIANGASSAEYFERQLWIFCSLAIGWVLFALVALSIVAHSRALATRRPDAADGLPPLGLTPQRAIGFLSYRTASTQMDHHHKPHQPAAAASSESLGDERGASGEYTMSSPVILVVSTQRGLTHTLSLPLSLSLSLSTSLPLSPHRCTDCPPSLSLSLTHRLLAPVYAVLYCQVKTIGRSGARTLRSPLYSVIHLEGRGHPLAARTRQSTAGSTARHSTAAARQQHGTARIAVRHAQRSTHAQQHGSSSKATAALTTHIIPSPSLSPPTHPPTHPPLNTQAPSPSSPAAAAPSLPPSSSSSSSPPPPLLITTLLCLTVALYCLIGLALSGAFAAIALCTSPF